MRKVLILGGCGYIGSKLFVYLTSRGNSVDTVDLEWFGNVVNPKNKKINYANLSKKFLKNYSAIILFAGHSTVHMCEEDKIGALKNNVENFILLTQKLDKQKFIYASTYRLYDKGNMLSKETDCSENLKSLYDISKKAIDYYSSLTSIEYYGLRMATVNGYSPNLRSNQIINKMFLQAKGKKKIQTYNPRSLFSILSIDDVCRAIEVILESDDKRGVYNLASFDTNVEHLSKKILKIFKNVNVLIKNENISSSHHVRIDTTKFKKTFNFKFTGTVDSVFTSLIENVDNKTQVIKNI